VLFRSGAQTATYDLQPQWTYGTLGKLFAEAVEQGKEPPVPAEVGYHNLRVVLAAYEAVRTGRAVDVD
jgi:predicted dehydrogenase